MNTHPHEEQLSAYMDGRLDTAQTRQVARHLNACPTCRKALGAFQQARLLLRGLDAPASPGPDFWADAYRRLRVEGNAPRTLRAGWTPRRWAAGLAAAALIAAAVVTPLATPGPMQKPPSAVESDFVDVSSLVRAHAASAARQPLADPDRQTMIAADVDDFPELDGAAVEVDGHASDTDAAP